MGVADDGASVLRGLVRIAAKHFPFRLQPVVKCGVIAVVRVGFPDCVGSPPHAFL